MSSFRGEERRSVAGVGWDFWIHEAWSPIAQTAVLEREFDLAVREMCVAPPGIYCSV